MGLPPGRTNNKIGRKVGSKNRVTTELRGLITNFIAAELVTVKAKYKKLSPRDQLRFITDLMPYGLSKLASVDVAVNFEALSDDQLDAMYQKVLTSINQLNDESE